MLISLVFMYMFVRLIWTIKGHLINICKTKRISPELPNFLCSVAQWMTVNPPLCPKQISRSHPWLMLLPYATSKNRSQINSPSLIFLKSVLLLPPLSSNHHHLLPWIREQSPIGSCFCQLLSFSLFSMRWPRWFFKDTHQNTLHLSPVPQCLLTHAA